MVNGPKYWWNLKDSNFIIFIDHREEYCILKSLSWEKSYVKSYM